MEALMIIKPALYLIVTTAVMGTAAGYKKSITEKAIRGALIPMALFGVAYYISIFILRNKSLDLMTWIYYGLMVATLIGVIVYDIKVKRKEPSEAKEKDEEPIQKTLIGIMIAIIAYHALRLGIMEPFAISDSFAYNSYTLDSATSGLVYNNDFIAGYEDDGTVNSMPGNMKTVSWYMYEAMVARVTNTHPLIVTGTVMPVYIILLSYAVLWILGKTLFKNSINKTSVFMILCAFIMEMQLIVNDTSAFFLVWPIWGKNIVSSVICPLIIAVYYNCMKKGEITKKDTFFMTACAFIAINSTAAAMIAIPMEMGVLSLAYAIRERKVKIILPGIIASLPAVLQFALYKGLL